MQCWSKSRRTNPCTPVAYSSRSLSRHEKNYGITELEALGVVWAVRHFRAYLYGHRCVVYTGHSPLKSMLKAQHQLWKLAVVCTSTSGGDPGLDHGKLYSFI